MKEKKRFIKRQVGLLIILISLLISTFTYAGSEVINEDINKSIGDLEIYTETTVNGNVKVNIGQLKVRGKVNGDVSADMGEVDIIGSVTGNVKADMGKVVIDGLVAGNVEADMGEILVNGDVGGNVFGNMGKINVSGTVGGDVESGLGEVVISGTVGGNVKSEERKVLINGTVEGDITLVFGTVELGPASVVGGTIYVEEGQVIKSSGAVYGGIEVNKELSAQEIDSFVFSPRGFSFRGLDNFSDFFRDGEFFRDINIRGFNIREIPGFFRFNIFGIYGNWGQKVMSMVIMFALALLIITLFPRQVENVRDVFESRIGEVVLWGVIAVILAIPLMILLAITLIGIPLIFVEILAFAVAWILGYTAISILVGERILETAKSTVDNPLIKLLAGVGIIGLLNFVPVAGYLVSIAVFVLAVGSSLVSGFGTKDKRQKFELPPAPLPEAPSSANEDI